ncbi:MULTISPECIES: CtsR family transcriptional regulator [Clostridiaceae]|uniref:CtsR family transcriptional regulator n=1 Tax=Clostridium facile TaxID=2763035 RepID=A0ABR7IPQ1_9CLOT|nr:MULTISPECIES: CtsR family transcriptional regulator [Clostridiaceae]MBC5787125.1 CtsR family transcriptional regulator [Clostridium facile]PWM99844.1 MAG: CtsR family transcriptional regulator [Massilioclostridium sp.]
MNITDMIAETIQQLLDQEGGATRIKRNELAEELGCVPSQINYVITSRFTPEQGYIIESKRGGGGYIKIMRVKPSQRDVMMHLINSVGNTLDEHSARIILQNLCCDKLLTQKEAKIIMSAISENTYKNLVPVEYRPRVRARLFKTMLLNAMD